MEVCTSCETTLKGFKTDVMHKCIIENSNTNPRGYEDAQYAVKLSQHVFLKWLFSSKSVSNSPIFNSVISQSDI